jgi:hypothetical protein
VLSRSATRHDLTLAEPGTLRLRAPEYLLDMPLRADSPSGRVSYELPAAGRLSVRTRMETCKVWIGGRDFGFPPIADQRVAPGTYELELRCPDGESPEKKVTVPAGGSITEVLP